MIVEKLRQKKRKVNFAYLYVFKCISEILLKNGD